ncbi:energy-coupling factor ABC transporter ATP-binding protein [Microbacterium gilvum]|uniref:ABC transporter ATP-binding protein n=1 Tax=Microbacterium gilvum TaxID=1336204 RepID=A0ABP8ZRQ7_9MICO
MTEHPALELELDGVGVEADGTTILDGVTVRTDAARVAVIGANGSGKSSFARVLGGLTPIARGRVRVHGIDPATHAIRDRVGFVFTNPDAQILMPTVAEDVALSLRGHGLAKRAIAERVAEALARHGLAAHADQPAYSLSGGQKQLLALVSVLVREPALVVADEPTTLLDLANARRIGDLLIGGAAPQVVVATHDLDLAERCDIVLRFADGRLVEAGDPATVIARYRAEFA